MLTHYLKITLRTIRKEKFRYIITTLGIAVGIVIFSAVLLVVDVMKGYIYEIPNADKLYKFNMHSENGENSSSINSSQFLYGISSKGINDLNKLPIPEMEKVGLGVTSFFDNIYVCNSDEKDKLFETHLIDINNDLLELLNLKFINGGIKNKELIKNSVIITEKYAKLLFETTKAIGNNISVYDNNLDLVENYTVIGVIKSPNYTSFAPTLDFITVNNLEDKKDQSNRALTSYVKVKKNADIERINSILKNYEVELDEYNIRTDSYNYVQLVPLINNQFKTPIVLRVGLLLIGGMILAISLINFVSLLISSMNARVRQFSLRKIVGAKKWTFVTMIIIEVIPVIIVSVLFSYFLLELFVHLSYIGTKLLGFSSLSLILTYPFKIGLWMLVGTIILSFLMSKRLQRIVLTQGIRGETFSISKNRIGNILLVIELMLTLIFINTSVYLTTSSFNSISEQYIPLSKAQSKAILSVPLNKLNLINKAEEIIDRIKSISGVNAVTDGNLTGYISNGFQLDNIHYNAKTDDMFEKYGEFWELDDPIYKRELAPGEAIINKEFADVLIVDDRNSFKLGSEVYNVVGVVDEIPLTKTGEFSALLGNSSRFEENISHVFVKCDPQSKDRVQKEIMKIIREYVPATIDYRITSLNDILDGLAKMLRTYAVIMLIASLFSIIITVLGIYTSITYDINRKRKEIAIRKINGASRKNILMFISKAYIYIILVSSVLASLLHRFLIVKIFKGPDTLNFKYSIVFDIAILLLMILIIAAIVYRKIRKAMSENPSEVIKSE